MNIAFLSVTRVTQAIDPAGNAAAAHTIAMQVWQLGGVVLFALSSVAAVLVPAAMNAPKEEGGGVSRAKGVADRMLGWGLCAGVALAILQLAALPLLNVFSPVASIREAARAPAAIGAALQLLNGVTFVAEGIMQGHQAFFPLARNAAVAAGGLVLSLRTFGYVVGSVVFLRRLQRDSVRRRVPHHLVTGPLGSRARKAGRISSYDRAAPEARRFSPGLFGVVDDMTVTSRGQGEIAIVQDVTWRGSRFGAGVWGEFGVCSVPAGL